MKLSAYNVGDNALCFVDMLSIKNPILNDNLKQSQNINISCLQDKNLNAKFYKCEIASISYVLALLCMMIDKNKFNDLDEGFLSAESCFGEEEANEVLDFLKNAKCIIFDENLKFHKDFENIKFFISFLSKYFNLYVVNTKEDEQELKINDFKELLELDNYDGLVVFDCPSNDGFLHCSKQFLQLCKLKNESEVLVFNKDFNQKAKLFLDENLNGTIGFLNFNNKNFNFLKVGLKEA